MLVGLTGTAMLFILKKSTRLFLPFQILFCKGVLQSLEFGCIVFVNFNFLPIKMDYLWLGQM
jgi:hypothetical protein